MIATEQAPEATLPPLATITIPPVLTSAAKALAVDGVHPAWSKLKQRGRYCLVQTDSLDDLSEIADWAQVGLREPEVPLTKVQRQAFQILLERTERWVTLEPLGPLHCWASSWKHKQR
jgi:hypothetical protein